MPPTLTSELQNLLKAIRTVRRDHRSRLRDLNHELSTAKRTYARSRSTIQQRMRHTARRTVRSEFHRADQALAAAERALGNVLQSGSPYWIDQATQRLNTLFLAVENQVTFLPDTVRASVACLDLTPEIRALLGGGLRSLPKPRLRAPMALPDAVEEAARSVDRASMASLYARIVEAMPELDVHESLLLKTCLLNRYLP